MHKISFECKELKEYKKGERVLITLRNSFHNTEVDVFAKIIGTIGDGDDVIGEINPVAISRASEKLCGIKDCRCYTFNHINYTKMYRDRVEIIKLGENKQDTMYVKISICTRSYEIEKEV